MVPFAFAYTRHREFAQSLLELVGQHDGDDGVLHRGPDHLAHRQRRRDKIRGMRGILFPVNIVEIECADHERVDQRYIDCRKTDTVTEHGRLRFAAHLDINIPKDLDIFGMIAAVGTSDRIVQVPFDLMHHIFREIIVLQVDRKFGDPS